MTFKDAALALAGAGYHVFPLRPGAKLPAIKDWPTQATRDAAQIETWWSKRDYNIGIATARFGDDRALIVVDVDVKNAKDGNGSILALEIDGFELPDTFGQATPSGGRHLFYLCATAARSGVDVLGSGLDIRSDGGFVVGPGSVIDGRAYESNDHQLAEAPGWLVDRLGSVRPRVADRDPVPGVDPGRARERALAYLATAPLSIEGQGGDTTAYKVAAALKDVGCTEAEALALLDEAWNERCEPPWTSDELAAIVDHAYRYGREKPGISAPEAVFAAADAPDEAPDTGTHPFARLNGEFAFIKTGAFVLQETTDPKGNFVTQHLNMAEFHGWHANKPFASGNAKPRPISECWVEWAQRREYEAVVFAPGKDAGARWYNMWRGFIVEPAAGTHRALDAFLEHAFYNVCAGDAALFTWLIGYFAHMVQRPFEKPLVALVFKGSKGVGKNALVERISWLLGAHALVADDDRYLLSNFNSHLEACLFLILDEAAWAGDKRAEGRLKGLITGRHHNIERKGKEPYKVDNLTRVAIIGNEDWLVPASVDERRFAVFNVSEGRKQDRAFFQAMREGMEAGGYAHLLRHLLDFDISAVDVNDAPRTIGLLEQKLASMDPQAQWWNDCLHAGEIVGGDFSGQWPDRVASNRLRNAFGTWCRTRNIRSRLPEEVAFGRVMHRMAPRFEKKRMGKGDPGDTQQGYFTPGLAALREDWEKHLGGKLEWPSQ